MSILEGIFLDASIQDRLIWTASIARSYSCISFRSFMQDHLPGGPIWKALCRISTLLKVNTFIWLLIKHGLPVRDRLLRFQMISSDQNIRPLCGKFVETFSHLFLQCILVSVFWYQVIGWWEVSLVCPNSFFSFLECGFTPFFLLNLYCHGV